MLFFIVISFYNNVDYTSSQFSCASVKTTIIRMRAVSEPVPSLFFILEIETLRKRVHRNKWH